MKAETARSIQAGHDLTRWKPGRFIALVIGFFIFMGAMFWILGMVTSSWTNHTFPSQGTFIRPQSTPGWNPSVPQLQTNAAADLQRMREQEYQQLHATKWTDDTHAFATIPIEKAMDLLAKAEAEHRVDQLLPPPKPATSLDLQKQKSAEAPKP